ncbi:MAG: hypothetical protein ACYTGH_12810 [Planctomycetota bacterium]|jgi:hypothetical protein
MNRIPPTLILLTLLFGMESGQATTMVVSGGHSGRWQTEAYDFSILREQLWDQYSTGYTPILLRIANRGKERTLGIQITTNSYRGNTITATHTVKVGARRETLVEIPLLRATADHDSCRMSFTIDGASAPKLNLYNWSRNYDSNNFLAVFLCPGWTTFQKSIESHGSSGSSGSRRHHRSSNNISSRNIAPELACRKWQSYLGLQGLVILDSSTLTHLSPEQREALLTWVRVGGGRIWIADRNWEPVANGLGLDAILRIPRKGDYTTAAEGLGRVIVSDPSLFKTITPSLFINFAPHNNRSALGKSFTAPRNTIHRRYHSNSISIPSRAKLMLGELTEVPVIGYLFCSLTLAILIGPVNLIWLRRRKKIILFYFTAPVIALAGVLVLMLYSAFSEGLGVKMRERAVLWHDLDKGDGAIYQERALYSGLPKGELRFPAETLISTWRNASTPPRLNYDTTSGLILTSGWLPSRTPTGLFALTPVRPRLGLEVREKPDGLYLINNSSHTAVKAYVQEKGTYYVAEDIRPGSEGRLSTMKYHRMPSVEPFPSDKRVHIKARMGGLPYLEDGGVSGELLDGEYWYIATRQPAIAKPILSSQVEVITDEFEEETAEGEEW